MGIKLHTPSKEEAERVRTPPNYLVGIIDFWADHHDEFLARYPEHYVAVKDALDDYEVVAADTDVVRLVETLDELGYDPREIEIEKVTAKIPYPMLIWR